MANEKTPVVWDDSTKKHRPLGTGEKMGGLDASSMLSSDAGNLLQSGSDGLAYLSGSGMVDPRADNLLEESSQGKLQVTVDRIEEWLDGHPQAAEALADALNIVSADSGNIIVQGTDKGALLTNARLASAIAGLSSDQLRQLASRLAPELADGLTLIVGTGGKLAVGDIGGLTVAASGSSSQRALQDRFADVINVRDFGALGDGSDDTAAIQAALDYANTDADNRPVVAFGDFVITSTLEMGRPAATRQDEPQQAFYFGNLVCGSDEHPWQGESTDPAVHFRAWRGILRIDKISCRRQCAGLFVDTYGAEIINPAIYYFAVDTYGLKWSSGGNIIWNPKIQHDRSTEAENQGRIPGILCTGIDSKVFGGIIGNCSPGIYLPSVDGGLNFFHGVHIYCGSREYGPITDPVLIRSDSTVPNYFFNCYYDSGHIDIYKTGLRLMGGHYLKNTNISTINGPLIRCYAEDNTGNFANLNVLNIHNAKACFNDGDGHPIPDSFDYSRINDLEIGGGQELRYERQTKRVLPNNYNTAYEIAYKPVGELRKEYYVGGIPEVAEGEDPVQKGVRITYLDNAIRICDPGSGNNGFIYPGARIRLGGGSAGISESSSAGGQTWIWANATVHLECAGNYDADSEETTQTGHVRPGVDDFDLLGTSSRRWKEFFCANGTINTSDERSKQQIAGIPESVFRAWGKVNFVQYKWNDAVEKKGEAARFHTGAIAQQIIEAFESEGLDATQYGLLCYDEWPAETHTVKVIDKEAVVDEEDRTVEPEVSHVETVVEPAGSRYSLRYGECLCLEAAYQRWLGEKRDVEIAELKARLSGV